MNHYIEFDKEDIAGGWIAHVQSADLKQVELVLSAKENTGDGRSEWVWIRLCNGDLILGVFPQGETYMEVSDPLSTKAMQSALR